MPYQRHLIIIPISLVANANGQAVIWDPDAGDDTFGSVLLSAGGTDPATHSCCNTIIHPEKESTLDSFYATGHYKGYRITKANASNGAGTHGAVEQYKLHPSRWEEIGTGHLTEIALSDSGLQIIKDDQL